MVNKVGVELNEIIYKYITDPDIRIAVIWDIWESKAGKILNFAGNLKEDEDEELAIVKMKVLSGKYKVMRVFDEDK